jgi:hypothetical protein
LHDQGRREAENATWSYETPYPAMKEIAGRLAFYPNRVGKIEAVPAQASCEAARAPRQQVNAGRPARWS